MNMRKLSINKACVLLGTLLLLAVGAVCAAVYLLTQNITAVRCVFLFSLFVLLCVIFFVALIRRKLVRFSDAFCGQMDDMLSGDMQPKQTVEEESLFYKINYRLGRLYEVMQENKNSIAKERADLQELISDISHQVKTPIANLKMINNTLLENEVPPQKQKEFLTAQASQLDKLDFLMQAMIKTSRLETGVISLEQKQQPVYDTLAAALGGILLNAEKKQIDVQVECPEHLDARHDRKWTSEALFNILDNAVKYTQTGGQIRVSVEGWEMYVKIDIADTGIGISEQHQGAIFKRFYREDAVHDVDGIGIGLYLAREIVTLQGGYIRVASEVGKYCEKWLLMQSVHVRATTMTDYTSKVRRHIIKELGDMRMADVTLDDIQIALVPVSQKSASVYKSVVVLYKSIFRAAKESRVIDKNPTVYLTSKGGGVPQKEKEALTDEQAARLLDAIQGLPPYVFVMLGLYAGLRREEILALQWDSVYLDTDTPYLTVRRAWHTESNRPVILDELKTKAAERNIPLPICLADCLKEAKANSTSEYVVPNRDGDPLSYTQFKRLWQYIVTRTVKERSYYRYEDGKRVRHTVTPVLGEKAAHNGKVVYSLDFEVTPHQLRHTYITNLIHSSVDPKTVQYLAGHESSKITMDIYAKVKYNRPDELVKSMGGAFAQWDGVRS